MGFYTVIFPIVQKFTNTPYLLKMDFDPFWSVFRLYHKYHISNWGRKISGFQIWYQNCDTSYIENCIIFYATSHWNFRQIVRIMHQIGVDLHLLFKYSNKYIIYIIENGLVFFPVFCSRNCWILTNLQFQYIKLG